MLRHRLGVFFFNELCTLDISGRNFQSRYVRKGGISSIPDRSDTVWLCIYGKVHRQDFKFYISEVVGRL